VRGIRRTTAVVLAAVALGGGAGLTGGSTAGLDGTAGAGHGDAGRRRGRPDFLPARTGPPERCPRYLAVDAGTGRG
jgi:hypothetical protein